MNKQKTQNITSEANCQTNNSVAQDELNVTADFYHPPRKEKGEIIITPNNNEKNNNYSGLAMQYRERNASYLDLNKKLVDQKLQNNISSGRGIKIRSTSNTSKYNMYEPQSMPYK